MYYSLRLENVLRWLCLESLPLEEPNSYTSEITWDTFGFVALSPLTVMSLCQTHFEHLERWLEDPPSIRKWKNWLYPCLTSILDSWVTCIREVNHCRIWHIPRIHEIWPSLTGLRAEFSSARKFEGSSVLKEKKLCHSFILLCS